MRKLSEIRGEDALDVLADVIEPFSEIIADDEFINCIKKRDRIAVAKVVMKNHKESILTILAVLEGVDPKDFNPSVIELPAMIIAFLNDPYISSVFHLADSENTSGSAMGSTEATEG